MPLVSDDDVRPQMPVAGVFLAEPQVAVTLPQIRSRDYGSS
jgi:hypothetical protein